jgi:hypothetical protein
MIKSYKISCWLNCKITSRLKFSSFIIEEDEVEEDSEEEDEDDKDEDEEETPDEA